MNESPDFMLSEPETLLFERSPYGSLDAMVQQDGRTAYLYLHSPNNSSFGTRAVWLRNFSRGPLVVSPTELQQGVPPMLPRTHCRHPDGQAPLQSEDLRLVWVEEGNGVALYEDDELLAVLPPWSGLDGFSGYARDCRSEHHLCWPLPQSEHLQLRLSRARQFWKQWESANPFAAYQQRWLNHLDLHMDPAGWQQGAYFAMDQGQWPPRGLQTYVGEANSSDEAILVTVGLGLTAMPCVELALDDPSKARRIELAVRLGAGSRHELEDSLPRVASWISGLARYPWEHITWIGHGHTGTSAVDAEAKKLLIRDPSRKQPADPANGLEQTAEPMAYLYVHDQKMPVALEPMQQAGDPVNLLWIVPLEHSQLQAILNKQVDVQETVKSLAEKSWWQGLPA